MGTLTYPFTLTAGANENVNDLNSNLTAIQTVVNGGIDATNLATNAVTTVKITDLNVTTAKIAALNVTDAKIASANNSVYKTVIKGTNLIGAGAGVTLGSTVFLPSATGGTGYTQSGSSATTYTGFYLVSTDFTVGSLTSKLRVRHSVASNATAAGATCVITMGLYPITSAGGAGTNTFTAGTVVGSSTAVISNPAASTTTTAVSSDFSLPSDGLYCVGFVVTGAVTAANNSLISMWSVETRNT